VSAFPSADRCQPRHRAWVIRGARAAAYLAVTIVVAVAGTPSAAAATRFEDGAGLVGRVFALADARLALMPEVAAAKLAAGVAIADPVREAAVVDAAAREAARLGLQSAAVRTLFAIQLRMARETQQVLHERWRGAAPERSEPASSLLRDLRPKLDALTPALLRAVYLALPVLEQPGFATDWSALAAIQLPAARWDAAMRAELLTALGAVRRGAGPSLARARAAGVLRIGTPGDYPPFSVETGATLDGADVELAIRLAAGLSLEPVFIRTSWAMLLDDLATDRFDIAVGGISVTPARLAVAAFAQPYASGGKTAIGRCADADRYPSLARIDSAGVRVIVNTGGTNERFVRSHLTQAVLLVHSDNRTIFEELRAGHADVMFTDDTEVALQTRRHPDLCRLLKDTFERADKAFLVARDPGLIEAVDGWLGPQIRANAPMQLLEQYLSQ
jgi:cyclohexadienyl dehydratase